MSLKTLMSSEILTIKNRLLINREKKYIKLMRRCGLVVLTISELKSGISVSNLKNEKKSRWKSELFVFNKQPFIFKKYRRINSNRDIIK
jgi:hypothetical protein